MSRFVVFLVVLSSVALCGGTTCRFSTGDDKRHDRDRDGTEVTVVVDTRVSGGSGAGPDAIEIVRDALGTSVLAAPDAAPPQVPLRLHTESAGRLASHPRSRGGASAIPEPGAIGLFLAGLGVIGWRARRRRRRR